MIHLGFTSGIDIKLWEPTLSFPVNHVLDADSLEPNSAEAQAYKTLERLKPLNILATPDFKKPTQDRRTLLEIDNKNFMQDLFIGNEAAMKHTNHMEEKLEAMSKSSNLSNPQTGLVISVKMNKKSTKNLKKNLNLKNLNLEKDAQKNSDAGYSWNKGKNLRYNSDNLRNHDIKRFELIQKELRQKIDKRSEAENKNLVQIPASGVYSLIEQRLLASHKTSNRSKR